MSEYGKKTIGWVRKQLEWVDFSGKSYARQYLLNSNRICIEFYRKVLSRKFYSQLSELLAPFFKD
jgi:hypothetical protein